MGQAYEGYDDVEVYTYGEAFLLARRGTFVFGGGSSLLFCFLLFLFFTGGLVCRFARAANGLAGWRMS
jgi:hypothetical protein